MLIVLPYYVADYLHITKIELILPDRYVELEFEMSEPEPLRDGDIIITLDSLNENSDTISLRLSDIKNFYTTLAVTPFLYFYFLNE